MNISLSTPINIKTNEQIQQNQLIQGGNIDQLKNITNYFYKFNRAGIGKNFIATYVLQNNLLFYYISYEFFFLCRLTESETKTTMNIFADHTGVIIDPSAVGLSNRNTTLSDMFGIRISPRQSPVYQPVV